MYGYGMMNILSKINFIANYAAYEDFRRYSVSLYFRSRDTVGTRRCVSVHIINDIKVEHDEYFTFYLYGGYRTQIAERRTRITILGYIGYIQ